MADPKIVYDIVANAEGGGEVDRLAASLEKLDQAIDPAAAARAQELSAELQRLGAQQAAVARFQELSAATEKAAADLTAADAAVSALRAEIDASGAPTTAQSGRLEKLGAAAQVARTELQAQTAALDASRGKLAALGVDADQAAKAEAELSAKTGALRAELQALGTSLQGVNARALVEDLKQLGAQQQGIQQLRDLGAATDKARIALEAAEAAAQAYGQKIATIDAPTAAQVNQQQRLGFAVDDARKKFEQQSAEMLAAGSKLAALGVETGNLAAAEERLRTAAQATVQEIQQLGQQQAALSATSRETEARTAALASHLQGLQTGFRDASGSADLMGQHLDAAFRTLGIKSVQQVTTEIDRLKAALVTVRSVDPFSADTQRAAVAMKEKVQALENELNQVPASAQRAGAGITNVGQASTSAAASIEGATLKAVQLGAALLGIGSAGQLAGGVLQTAAEFETLRAKLEQLLGSTSAATAAFDQIKQLAITTPFEVKDLTAAFTTLANFGLKPTQTQMLALADTAAVAGGGTEALQRITLALGQAWAKTKLQGDEILQLTEAGVPVYDLLAKATHKNVVELQQLSKDGALGRDVIIKLFDAIGERNAGASVKLMATFSGTVSNAKDAMAEFFDLIGRSGALDYLTKKLTEALDEFQRLKDTGELERKAKAISDAVIKFAQGVEVAFEAVSKLSKVLELLAAAWAAEKVVAFTTALLGVKSAATVATVATTELAAAQRVAAASAVATSAAVATTGASASAAAVGVGLLGRAMGLLRGLGIGAIVLGVAELASKFFEAKKAAEDGDAAVRKMLNGPPEGEQKAKVAIRDVVSELDDFKKKLPNLQSDIAGLTGEGLAAVAASTIENLRAIKASAVDMSGAIVVVAERAAQTLGIELPTQAAKSSDAFKGVKTEADLLIAQLPNLGLSAQAASNVVAQALSRMVDSASTQHDFDQISASIKLMADAGRIGPGAVSELLEKVRDRAREVKDNVEAATPGIQSLGEAARKAGVDIGELTTGVSKSFRDSAQDVTNLAEQIQKSGVSAERAGPLLKAAIDQRISAAQTKDELLLLAKSLQEMADKGQLAGVNVGGALATIKQKAAELSPVLIQARADAERLGVTLKDNIQGGATAGVTGAITAYERLKGSGKASAKELQDAFVTMANEAIKANGGIVSDWIKVEAATRGATIAVDDHGRAVVRAAKDASNALGDELQQVQSLSSGYETALKKANDLTLAASKASDAARKAENSVPINDSTRADLETRNASGGLTSADLAAAKANLEAAKNNYTLVSKSDPASNTSKGRSDALAAVRAAQSIVDKLTSGKISAPAPAVAAPAPAPVASAPSVPRVGPSSVPAVGSTVHKVEVSFNGQSSTINTASADDSVRLAAMLKSLESAARSSGYA